MSETPKMPGAAGRSQAISWRRAFAWSVRRELWENRAVLLAPPAIAGVVLLGFLISSFHLPATLQAVAQGDAKRAESLWMAPSAAAAAVMVTGLIVALFYSVSALHTERRDRSILFWKSLPVSDVTTVLAKAAIPLAVTPMVTVAVVFATQALMLVWRSLVAMVAGADVAVLWAHQDLTMMWVVLPYGLLVNALWQAPLFAWFLLVSAWARRSPILWALGAPAALALAERLALGTTRVWSLISHLLFGGFAEAFSVGGQSHEALRTLADLDPMRTFSRPDLWAGVLAAAVLLAACVWLRRRREPL